MIRVKHLVCKRFALATSLVVFASSLSSCTPQQPDQASRYVTAKTDDVSNAYEHIRIKNDRESPQERIKDRSIESSLQRMRESYKLVPDRRFLSAIAEIHFLLTGESKSEVTLEREKNQWLISYKDQSIGRLKDFPSGTQLFNFLRTYAHKLKEQSGPQVIEEKNSSDKLPDSVRPIDLFPAMLAVNDGKSSRNQEKVQRASTAAAWLSNILIDDTGSADSFFARALALKACELDNGNVDSIRNECLLAHSMHYYEHARRLSNKLPATDSVRLFLQQDLPALAKLISKNEKSARNSFLYLTALARARDSSQWLNTVRNMADKAQPDAVAIVRSACEFESADTQLPVGQFLIVAASRELANPAGAKPIEFQDISWSYEKTRESSEWQTSSLARDFEDSLQQSAKTAANESTTRESPAEESIRKNYYRVLFATGAYRIARSYMTFHIDLRRAAMFSKSLKVDNGPSAMLAAWLDDLQKTRVNTAADASLISELEAIKGLGAKPLSDLVRQGGSFFDTNNPYKLIPAGRRIFELADTRPETKLCLSEIADNSLVYPKLSHMLRLALLKDGSASSLGGRLERAMAFRNIDEMLALLKTGRLSAHEELNLLAKLETLESVHTNAVTALYRQSLARHAMAWDFIEPYCKLLIAKRQFGPAKQTLQAYINKNSDVIGSETIRARAILASIALSEKRYQDGRKLLSALENTEQSSILILKARLLEASGQREDAEKWAKEALNRFPKDPKCIALCVEILWKNGKYSQASKLLSTYNPLLSKTQWRDEIAPAFADIFAEKPATLLLAVDSLIDAGIKQPSNLGQITRALFVADRPEQAFQMLTKVRQQSVDAGDLYTCAYRYLKRWKGEASATKWLTAEVQEADRIKLAPFAFLTGQYELLWSVIPDQAKTEDTDRLWLMRAASCLVDADLNKAYKNSLTQHFKGDNGTFGDLGRYLMGQTKSYPGHAVDSRLTCISAFYIGWKILAGGESFFDGTELYHLALETENPSLSEFQWSQMWLTDLLLTLQNNPAAMDAARHQNLRIVGPHRNGEFGAQRRFTISAF